MNRWGFASVLVVVAGAVATLAIYTFGWRDRSSDTDGRALARVYAEGLDAELRDGEFEFGPITHVTGDVWQAQRVRRDTGAPLTTCWFIDVQKFERRSDGSYKGLTVGDCNTAP